MGALGIAAYGTAGVGSDEGSKDSESVAEVRREMAAEFKAKDAKLDHSYHFLPATGDYGSRAPAYATASESTHY